MTTLEYSKAQGRGGQQVLPAFKDFIVNQCGWTLEYTVSETGSDVWYILSTLGTQPGRYRKGWFALRSYSGYIDVDVGTAYLGGSTLENSVWVTTSQTPANNVLTSHFFGNEDGVWWVFYSSSDDDWYYLYIGYFDSVYTDEEEERYPVCTIGHRYDYRWLDEDRIRAYYMWNSTYSGVGSNYHVHKDTYTYGAGQAQPGSLDGTNFLMPLVMRNGSEVRGVLKHIRCIGGQGIATKGSWVTVSGSTHKYFVVGNDNVHDEWVCFGPVSTSSGTSWVE